MHSIEVRQGTPCGRWEKIMNIVEFEVIGE